MIRTEKCHPLISAARLLYSLTDSTHSITLESDDSFLSHLFNCLQPIRCIPLTSSQTGFHSHFDADYDMCYLLLCFVSQKAMSNEKGESHFFVSHFGRITIFAAGEQDLK
jgi:hypothetical protein